MAERDSYCGIHRILYDPEHISSPVDQAGRLGHKEFDDNTGRSLREWRCMGHEQGREYLLLAVVPARTLERPCPRSPGQRQWEEEEPKQARQAEELPSQHK